MNTAAQKSSFGNTFYRAKRSLIRSLTNKDSVVEYLEPILSSLNPKYHPTLVAAKVISITWQNSKIYTITLKPESKKFNTFIAGQSVLIEVIVNGRRLQRTFSISSTPDLYQRHGIIQLSIREQDKGLVTPWLGKTLQSGDYIHISQAQGEFNLKNRKTNQLFIAAGSGLTPLLSMLNQEIKHPNSESHATRHLIYFVPDKNDLPFKSDIEIFEQNNIRVQIVDSSIEGHLQVKHLSELKLNFGETETYLCGPGTLISDAIKFLEKLGSAPEDIHFEYFGTPSLWRTPSADDQEAEELTIQFSSSRLETTQKSSEHNSLLEIAEGAGLKPVSGCRAGICHQCICTKKSGRVKNLRTQEISDSGQEEIQLCISAPVENVSLQL